MTTVLYHRNGTKNWQGQCEFTIPKLPQIIQSLFNKTCSRDSVNLVLWCWPPLLIDELNIHFLLPNTRHLQPPTPKTARLLKYGSKQKDCSTWGSGRHFTRHTRSHLASRGRSGRQREAKLCHGNRTSSSFGTHAESRHQKTSR